MNKKDQVENIVCFLLIVLGEEAGIILSNEMHPDYLLEKFYRYVLSDQPEHEWGIRPGLRGLLDLYVDKWEEALDD
jgi:hypothetical protein